MHLARSLIFEGHFSEGLTCTEEGMERLSQDPTLGIDLLGYSPYTNGASCALRVVSASGELAGSSGGAEVRNGEASGWP
jgi:hypothetical protein